MSEPVATYQPTILYKGSRYLCEPDDINNKPESCKKCVASADMTMCVNLWDICFNRNYIFKELPKD